MNTTSLAGNYADRYFFRTADKMRLEGCVHAVGQEGQSLTLCCDEETLLDHYLQLLLSDLRASAPQHKIEVYFPTSPDSLIARFNEALSHRKVEEAARAQDPGGAGQIWVIHDPSLIADAEMQLLGRLIQSLPGANIRLIVLQAGAAAKNVSLASLKRQMLRWDIDVPSAEQALAALEFSERSGQLQPLRRLLMKLCALDPVTAAAANELTMTSQRVANPAQAAVESPDPATTETQPGKPQPLGAEAPHEQGGKRRSQILKLGALLGSALVISTGLMMWMQPQSFGIADGKAGSAPTEAAGGDAGTRVKPGTPKPAPAPVPTTEPRSKAASPELLKPTVEPAKPTVEPTKPAAESAKPVAEPVKPVAEPAKTAQASAQISNPKAAEVRSASEAAGKPAAAPAASASPKPAAQPESDLAKRLGDPATAAQWMRELAPGSFVIWHAVFPSYDAALAYRKSHRVLERSVIVSTWRSGQNGPLFAVISAPFASAAQAYAALKSDTYPQGNWVRPARDVQAELTAPNAGERRS
jgi:outer membrane biosynthesis protein TonB